ncbi:S-adenosyl-L-methionine-dependent methyltransferase [Sanghuangporus baumii]|uniref:tRNA (cytosine(38)-C(5))-methyltransferase n=1 Tax=Sanghuangporus baumii TaxID=108892 RepID=A0A9Q5I0F4_SANBA|nr:S-adenosyl-L-methionine-dependent methyltransferase [Sanghuangporus baumii]
MKPIMARIDISSLTVSDLEDLDTQLWLLSPSCQPYTVLNPNAKGAQDPRAKSFLRLVQNVIPDLARRRRGPKWMLVENVAGFEASSVRGTLIESLQNSGYNTLELLLTPLQFGIPNSRLRYYLLAKEQPMSFANVIASEEDSRIVWRNIPGHGKPWKDNHEDCDATQLRTYLDPDASTNTDLLCRIPDRVLLKWGRLFDIVLPSSRRSCCFTRGYTQLVERAGSILQTNEALDTTEVFNKFLSQQRQKDAKSGERQEFSEDALLSILSPLRLRYFSPSELLRLFHFEPPTLSDGNGSKVAKFVWPDDVTLKAKYRLLGNSVNVEVVRRLVNYLFESDGLVE